MQWTIYTRDTQNLLLHVSARHGCHLQGDFRVVKAVISKWTFVCTTVTHLETY
jgi:hypothetical protein